MIKVGDYIKHKGNEVIYKVVSRSEKLLYVTDFKQTWQHIGVDVATKNYIVVDYKQLYEQQKQRADELEKRWSELVDVLKKKYEYYKVRADDESAGPIEQSKWEIAKHEMMMTLMAMADLQEDDNA